MGSRAKRFAVTLIKPSRYDSDGYVIQWRTSCVPSNSLGCLFALTRDCAERKVLGPDVEIEYEAFDEPNMLLPVERLIQDMKAADGALLCLVGVQSNQFPRAMHIARRFRRSGIPVAIGGFHVSGCLSMLKTIPADIQEAIDLGVSIFAGEAESGRYESLLKDVWAGTAKPIYNYMKDLPNLAGEPVPYLPDYVIDRIAGTYATLDSGRGCPYQCSFCSIINVQGRISRWRTPDDVEAVIRENYARGVRRFFFTDDNFARNKDWEHVLDRLIKLREEDKLRFKFVIQADALAHKNEGFIEKATRAGCHWVYIGLENINPENLIAAKKRQNKIWEYRKMLQIWKKHGVMVYAGYITGFPFDSRETILRDIEILKRELAIEVLEIFYLTPLPGSEDHQRLTNQGVWMDPDMNKYSLSERVTHHAKMSDEEWESAYHEAWRNYYNPKHIERIMRRAAANGKPLNKVLWAVLWFWACHEIEGIHPVEGGYIRRKVRTERRPGFKIESPIVFYPKRAADFLWKGARWLRLLWIVKNIARKVEADPAKREYMDAALTPVVDDREAVDELEMIRTHAASANRLQRAHIHRHGEAEAEPMVAAE
jgi:tRNA A37 methylthiotransferase MiaB